ncbi:HAMP domain-containing protein [endosymbiont of Lamellibrachia barhami]|uniref:HAMP domain-containing protein n=1 Tax=endosymbiont of Lamellibrachia barhami TaxID=205975 RepID=UPI0015AD22C2|nr:HAMP domain-containing protein [endosymbiont of Lamellibrachia barhami]
MSKITRNFRIGEKIGFGFGLVGLIFLLVIWQYHNTLRQSLGDYQRLQSVFVAKKVDMLSIESSMRGARQAERGFLLYRDEAFAREVDRQLQQAQLSAAELGRIDPESVPVADRITELLETYQQKFQATVLDWRKMGLDHNSGLQGTFRDAAHELETMAGHFRVDRLYLQLLQIRRSEKDLGLRREQQYLTRVLDLIHEFERKTAQSQLEEGVKTRLFHEIETYRETFEIYARAVLSDEDIQGGKGPFRQAAHRIEAILNNHHVPELANNILQLRRREKDYLLRHDKKYVDMALQEVNRIHALVEPSTITAEEKTLFLTLLKNYRRDFTALVEQNDHIDRMTGEMQRAVSEITLLIKESVASANQVMARMEREINTSSDQKERFMLWSVAVATLLGIIFAISITLRIVRPLRSMAGILDQLAYEETTERLPFYPNARDEVNAMAGSVNTMADNKSRFIAWWKSSMREADACENLETILKQTSGIPERDEAESEFRNALAARHELLFQQYHKLHVLNGAVIEQAEALQKEGHSGETQISINTIRYSSHSMQNILEMVAFQENQKRTLV